MTYACCPAPSLRGVPPADLNGAVAAHADHPHVVEADDAGRAAPVVRLVRACRAVAVELFREALAARRERPGAEIGQPLDDDARRLASGMGIDDLDALHGAVSLPPSEEYRAASLRQPIGRRGGKACITNSRSPCPKITAAPVFPPPLRVLQLPEQGILHGGTSAAKARCEIYSIARKNALRWKWRHVGARGVVESQEGYELFFECVRAARASGYEPAAQWTGRALQLPEK